mmetsp:Transcript_20230/g.61409  ORF Transcript_20230/g.61409 Transcript_20230/m.61409 type:complete len:327 (-) Transcript_20230:269-1249(-)
MLDTLRRAGVRTPRQCGCASWDEVGAFVRSLRMSHFRLVLKPDAKAAALDAPGVALCTSMQQAMDGFSAFRERDAGAAVCVQEYLPGADFFVDVVSCGGEHKCVALWVQAPRFVGAEEAAVPPALRLLETRTGEAEEALLELAVDALKALGVAYGPSQVQLRAALEGEDYGAAARSAMVVDVTCAFHGGGADIHHAAKLGVGYSQISACVDLALAHGAGLEAFPTPFTLLPSRPIRLHRHAAEVDGARSPEPKPRPKPEPTPKPSVERRPKPRSHPSPNPKGAHAQAHGRGGGQHARAERAARAAELRERGPGRAVAGRVLRLRGG